MFLLEFIITTSGCIWTIFNILGSNVVGVGNGFNGVLGVAETWLNSNPFYELAINFGFAQNFSNTYYGFVSFIDQIGAGIENVIDSFSNIFSLILPDLNWNPLLSLVGIVCVFGLGFILVKFIVKAVSVSN